MARSVMSVFMTGSLVVCAAAALFAAGPLGAQDYPAKRITLVVPNTAGGVLATNQVAQAAPDVRERYRAQGSQVVAGSPEAFGAWIRAESAKWERVIRSRRITLD